MRSAVLAILLLAVAPALAQDPGFAQPHGSTVYVPYKSPCIAKLSQLAARLHVGQARGTSLLVAQGCDGNNYDILALLDALLDRIDKHERKLK